MKVDFRTKLIMVLQAFETKSIFVHFFKLIKNTDEFVDGKWDIYNNYDFDDMAYIENFLLNILLFFLSFTYCHSQECYNETCRADYYPHGPLVHCKFL